MVLLTCTCTNENQVNLISDHSMEKFYLALSFMAKFSDARLRVGNFIAITQINQDLSDAFIGLGII